MAVATRKDSREPRSTGAPVTVRVVALTHAFYDMRRYRRGDEVEIPVQADGALPAWCIGAEGAPRDPRGGIDLNALPLFFPANARG